MLKSLLLISIFLLNFPCNGKEVSVGVGNFEPYFIAKGKTGLFTELLDAIFARIPNYQPKYRFDRSNNRLFQEFKDGNLDAVANVFESMDLAPCHSKSFFHFQDMAMSRAKDKIQINRIEDLKGKAIITFQGARKFLGNTFAEQTQDGPYIELANPGHQVRQLARGKGDVSVGDLFVFLHNLQKVSVLEMTPADFHYHKVIPRNSTRMGFNDTKLCQLFGEALNQIKEEGIDKAIYTKYFKKYHAPVSIYKD